MPPEDHADLAHIWTELETIKRYETRISLKDIAAIGTLLVVLGGGIIALYTKVARIEAHLDAHVENMGVHPGQDERRKIVREEIDRALIPVLAELIAIKDQLADAKKERSR